MNNALHTDEWFLLAYTGYVVVSVLALMWVGREGRETNMHAKSRRTGRQRFGDRR